MSEIRCEVEETEAVELIASGENRQSKTGRGLRFSLKALLILTTLCCVGIGHLSNEALKNQRSIEFLEGPEVLGQVQEYREIWFAKLTPWFIQDWIGREHFQTPDSIYLNIQLKAPDPEQTAVKPSDLHNVQQVLEALSQFKRLSHLELRLGELDSLPESNDPSGNSILIPISISARRITQDNPSKTPLGSASPSPTIITLHRLLSSS